ncbi:hypothetical protein K525DRAFT_274249 [Schizophyllum commune Loenen D]|nr:hypothetical protein K525DRAFT_274249 [Schizophyllum commune Loenen D]
MTSTTPAPDPNLPDAAPSAAPNEVGRTGLHYPDARLPEAPYPYLLRTRVNKEIISDVEQTTVRSCSIISRGLFPDDIFPVEPAELVVDLDKITYDLDNQRWLLDCPRTSNSESPCPTRPANGFPRAAPRPFLDGKVDRVPEIALIDADVDPESSDVLCDIQMVPTEDEFLVAFRDAVEVHQVLYYMHDLLHCNISDNTIMLRGQGGSSPRRGLLIAFDSAVLVTDREAEKTAYMGYRADTLPFMSYEFLRYRRVRHGPWHDLESFLYVLIFVCATCAGSHGTRRKGFELSQSPLAPWLVGNEEYKEEVMRKYDDNAFRAFLDSVFDPYFDDLKNLVCELRTAILPENKTPVCHDDVLDILDQCIELRRAAFYTDSVTDQDTPSPPNASVDTANQPI